MTMPAELGNFANGDLAGNDKVAAKGVVIVLRFAALAAFVLVPWAGIFALARVLLF